ncbi:molybdopterin-dependent oxidoreductase [Halogeometricum borinquense]|uniref:Sulfite oxidase-like oxidoreductase n=1 Tax=Halogeometricum borinquense (strain ATCC 700274 / DSM 11551 / JCM 10706 / KCTC 4070 / PR3) TaxID=469382 RepID=E4NSN0_HALBP|nr:molybdopterin-dependent oxidoreductase [Halogeometricum borinquense]ADQ68123.1 sulfite oxidase-like oxidoreductase [Halogeometricum borinquense DSM 11551]ELY24833.1 sulfite oxidase-like oxidoreductase [Halogeometricum borinquense DSM 11551]QIQ77319.1 molybdopterin-dependent oxidoreductase [Halogeometricum borinquense]
MTSNRLQRVGPTSFVAFLAGVAAVAGSYATAGFTPAFVVAPVAAFLTRTVPDAVLRFAIVTLGTFAGIDHFGQLLNLALATGLTTALLAGVSFLALVAGRRLDARLAPVGLVGASMWVVTVVLTGQLMLSLGAAVGGAVVVLVAELAAVMGEPSAATDSSVRRRVLGGVASAFGVGILSYLFGRSASGPAAVTSSVDGSGTPGGPDGSGPSSNDSQSVGDSTVTQEYLAEAERRTLDVDGLEGLVSDDFYQVDINNIDPNLRASDWTLSVTGSVEQEATYTYDELTAMGDEQRFVTLRCVSDKINGTLMDTDLWTGVPISRILDEVNPQGAFVMLRAADDYFEEFPVEALEDGFLAYGKRGGPLPRAHGHPVRALIPGHWGEINVKWVTEMEILDGPEKGFWERRGWHGTGPVNTVAKLHTTNRRDGQIQAAGHAYAGTRGIERVEVSIDGGETWADATLSDRLPAGTDESGEAAEDAWRQWEHTYENPGRRHTVVVRATDSTGTLQPREEESPFPSGATGWVSKTISP